MTDYVLLFRSTPEQSQDAMGSPERAQQSVQSWLAWIRELESSGHLRERGQPLDRRGQVVRGATVTDGPFAEAKDIVLGFLIIQAHDDAQAAALAKGCPIAIGGGSVEVRPVMALPAPTSA